MNLITKLINNMKAQPASWVLRNGTLRNDGLDVSLYVREDRSWLFGTIMICDEATGLYLIKASASPLQRLFLSRFGPEAPEFSARVDADLATLPELRTGTVRRAAQLANQNGWWNRRQGIADVQYAPAAIPQMAQDQADVYEERI